MDAVTLCHFLSFVHVAQDDYIMDRTHLLPFSIKHVRQIFRHGHGSVWLSLSLSQHTQQYLGKSSSCHSSFTSMLSMRKVASAVPILSRGGQASAHWGRQTDEIMLEFRKSTHSTYSRLKGTLHPFDTVWRSPACFIRMISFGSSNLQHSQRYTRKVRKKWAFTRQGGSNETNHPVVLWEM